MAGMEDATPGTSSARRPGMGLGTQILIGMVLGSFLGAVLGERVTVIQPVGDLFIRLLVLAAIPLVFFNLLAGLTALSDVRTFGRLATKIMSYYVVTDLVGLSLGLAAVALLRPGVGMQLTEQVEGTVGAVPSIGDVLLGMVPSNVFRAFADGNVVQLVVVAVLLGIATLMLTGSTRDRLSVAFSDLAALFRRLVDLILLVAPLGIGALMAVTVGRYGASLLGPMTKFLLGVYAGQLVIFVGYMVLLCAFTDRRPLQFLRDTGPLWATTAATTSSLASLSVGLEIADPAAPVALFLHASARRPAEQGRHLRHARGGAALYGAGRISRLHCGIVPDYSLRRTSALGGVRWDPGRWIRDRSDLRTSLQPPDRGRRHRGRDLSPRRHGEYHDQRDG